jgi:hypothetical protein
MCGYRDTHCAHRSTTTQQNTGDRRTGATNERIGSAQLSLIRRRPASVRLRLLYDSTTAV